MDQNKLFCLTRWRLAGWYAGVMAFILSISGFGVYQVVAHAYYETIDQALESVALGLQESIEPVLKQPGRWEQIAQEQSHIPHGLHQVNYYMRFLDRSGEMIALAGFPPKRLPITSPESAWQTLKDSTGNRYRQISLSLHTQDNQWGYMQVGRSLNDMDKHIADLRLTLLLGSPIAMLLVGGSSWWLAGLAMQPVYRSYEQMQQFTADVTHEFSTPLAATQSTVESALLLNSLPEAETREILQAIKRQITRLSQLVGDLLLLARLERQELALQRLPCCLNDLVSDLLEELADLAIKANVMLSAKVLVQKTLSVLGDSEHLYRMVSNLIVNAIHYTMSGGQITVILGYSDPHALIHVQDTGIGIAPEHHARIFDRFYRVDQDRSRHTGGSGLGLTIAHAIALAHNGSLQVESQVGKGSTFTVRLPLD